MIHLSVMTFEKSCSAVLFSHFSSIFSLNPDNLLLVNVRKMKDVRTEPQDPQPRLLVLASEHLQFSSSPLIRMTNSNEKQNCCGHLPNPEILGTTMGIVMKKKKKRRNHKVSLKE